MNHGEKLKNFLEARNISRIKLAADLGMSRQNLYQLFRSKRFGLETIGKLEKILNVNWEDIDSVNTDSDNKKTSGDVPDVTMKYINLLEKTLNEEREEQLAIKQLSLHLTNLEKTIENNQASISTKLQNRQELILKKIDELSRRISHRLSGVPDGKPPHGRSRK